MYSIYKITNLINNKIYIGQTGKTITERFNIHLKMAKRRVNRYLYDAMNKYGYNNFKIELIEKCEKIDADDREIFWIKKLNATNPDVGYNMTSGGGGGDTWTKNKHKKETIEKSKQTKIKNGTWGKSWGPHISPMKGKHFKEVPSKEQLLEYICKPLTVLEICKKYNCDTHLILNLTKQYFNKNIRQIRKEYNTSFKRTEKQLEALKRMHQIRKPLRGDKNGMYKNVDKDILWKLIQQDLIGEQIAEKLGVSTPTMYEKCKYYFRKTFGEIKKELNYDKSKNKN